MTSAGDGPSDKVGDKLADCSLGTFLSTFSKHRFVLFLSMNWVHSETVAVGECLLGAVITPRCRWQHCLYGVTGLLRAHPYRG